MKNGTKTAAKASVGLERAVSKVARVTAVTPAGRQAMMDLAQAFEKHGLAWAGTAIRDIVQPEKGRGPSPVAALLGERSALTPEQKNALGEIHHEWVAGVGSQVPGRNEMNFMKVDGGKIGVWRPAGSAGGLYRRRLVSWMEAMRLRPVKRYADDAGRVTQVVTVRDVFQEMIERHVALGRQAKAVGVRKATLLAEVRKALDDWASY